ncbi:glycosyltransferase family 32 protein [Volucribacter amazonae]|uniref:Glycosyl transferase n=1 Tax=Volucribacter amazonae TaxID=256731 RepID=A0A9X4PBM5_9PAST|nr:glycosyltransferase [Volucribacter amazonae]MDG6894381.1 glycosyl transferase [Volucribacter amazonae]
MQKTQYYIILSVAGLLRLLGHSVKMLGYIFHFFFPKKRFSIPEFSPAKFSTSRPSKISRIVWQTNYTNQVTLPVYCNYLLNRLLSLSYDYRYMGTEQRQQYLKQYADERTYQAYCKLTDGAAQADFWRVFTLYHQGGVYLDMDAHLVWRLAKIVGADDNEVLITRRGLYTNFFLACAKGNPILQQTLDIIIDNIECKRVEGGVFFLTGPVTLNQAVEGKSVKQRLDKITCVQGTFTNEYFQYMDKKQGKWTHAKNEDLLKDNHLE